MLVPAKPDLAANLAEQMAKLPPAQPHPHPVLITVQKGATLVLNLTLLVPLPGAGHGG